MTKPIKEEIQKQLKEAKTKLLGADYLHVLTETINLCSRELHAFFEPKEKR